MATDSTELTFVRCRSCGALVAASAARCKMCNAPLEGAAKVDESSPDSKMGGRIRQRTMSAPEGDVMSAVSKLRDKDPVSPVADLSTDTPPSEPETKSPLFASSVDDDPLGSLVEEIEGDDEEDLSNPFDDIDDDFESPIAKTTEKAPSKGFSAFDDEPKETVAAKESDDFERPKFGGTPVGSQGPAFTPKQDTKVVEPPAEEVAPKPRTNDARPSSQFTKPAQAPNQPANQGNKGGGQQQKNEKSFSRPGQNEGSSGQQNQQRNQQTQRFPQGGGQQRNQGQQQAKGGNDQSQNRPEQQRNQPQSGQQLAQKGPSADSTPQGKLCAWFVSFVDADGEGIELRAGKFFVTRNSLKPSDLVIDQNSISTPHAMLAVGAGSITVQDLMSEQGVFVKRAGANQFERQDNSVKLAHGDSIKFGNVEYLVALLPAR